MNKQQLIDVSREMLLAGNLTQEVADFWTKQYGVRDDHAWQAISIALDEIGFYAPRLWEVNEGSNTLLDAR